jgi:hypothetical protein
VPSAGSAARLGVTLCEGKSRVTWVVKLSSTPNQYNIILLLLPKNWLMGTIQADQVRTLYVLLLEFWASQGLHFVYAQ